VGTNTSQVMLKSKSIITESEEISIDKENPNKSSNLKMSSFKTIKENSVSEISLKESSFKTNDEDLQRKIKEQKD